MTLLSRRFCSLLFVSLQVGVLIYLSPDSAFSATEPEPANSTTTAPPAPLTAELLVHNRSGYPMTFALWKNGKNCTEKMLFDPNFNIDTPQGKTLIVPAEKQIASGVAILEIRDKLPVVCDYILSFKLTQSTKYMLEYDVHDRQCYGQLYQSVNGTYQLILPGERGLHERFSVLGWDKTEPGCEEE